MPPRLFDPDEELAFRFTAAEANTLLAIVDTTTGFPHRVTHPLWAKILTQANAGSAIAQPPARVEPPLGDGMVMPEIAPDIAGPPAPARRRNP